MAEVNKCGADLRFLFMRGLIDHEKSQRSRHYLKSAAECTSRAIVSLELSPEPVISCKQAKRLEGIGGETCTRLAKLDEERNFSSLKPLPGRYVSSAGAILVTLLDMYEELQTHDNYKGKEILVPEDKVRLHARDLCEEPFIDEDKEGFCVAWWRLEVLIKRGYIKRRSKKKASVLQLLPPGEQIAGRLKGPDYKPRVQTQKLAKMSSAPSDDCVAGLHDDSFTPNSMETEKPLQKCLYSNDNGQDGVVMWVDTQEMGGERAGLGELCRLLGQNGVCYRTRKLSTGDYGWFWRKGHLETNLPCLVERKRADDIPGTLKEGRFWSQINKMMEWKKGFTDRGIEAHIHYLLERKPEEFVVKCTDGCQGIGQCGNPTLAQIKMVIEDLKHHPELLVKETDSLEVTVMLLKSFTDELKERVRMGDFDNLVEQPEITKEPNIKTETGSLPEETEINLSYEEQLQLALENSLMDVHTDISTPINQRIPANHESVLDQKGQFQSDIEMNWQEPSTSSHTSQSDTNITPASSKDERISDMFVKKSDAESPLMQYHCTVESSVTCQSHSKDEIVEPAYNEYRPKINRKRPYHVMSTDQEVSTISDTSPLDAIEPKKKNEARSHDVSTDNVYLTNIVGDVKSKTMDRQLGASKDNTSIENSLHDIKDDKLSDEAGLWSKRTADLNHIEIKADPTDEILDSFRHRYTMKVENQSRNDVITITEDEVEDKMEKKSKSKFKPIKLNLSPSKSFIETNIVKVKQETTGRKGKKKGGNKQSKQMSNSLNGSGECVLEGAEQGLGIKDNKNRKESEPDRLGDMDNVSSNNSRDGGPMSTNTEHIMPKLDDNKSYNSMEDIFADSPAGPKDVDQVDSVSLDQKNEDSNDSNDKVRQWLDNSRYADTVPPDNTREKLSNEQSAIRLDENSNDSLPDIIPKLDKDDGASNEVIDIGESQSDEVIVVHDENNLINTAGPSNILRIGNSRKGKRKGRKGHDSGYESGDIRNKSNTLVGDRDDALNEAIETVLGILPHVKRSRIITILRASGNNIEQCISQLLDEGNDLSDEEEIVIDLTD